MCGIAGLYDSRPDAHVDPAAVNRMLATIVHRGPDDQGVHDGGAACLGTRRLKIIDLDGGHQPLSNEDGTVWVAFNGEIYNHADLRRRLQAAGHRFATDHSDTEVLVHAWEEYGTAMVGELHGMFGFAIWDSRQRCLFLARDRLGIKPLYYAWDGARLAFGSEIKAILEAPGVERAVDLQSLYHYVGYEYVPAPATMFAGIRKLPAGHVLELRGTSLTVTPYWDVSFEPVERSEAEYVSGLRDRLARAVERRLMSDVPLGVFLSGGLDSTAVLALARQATGAPLPTFTIGYRDASFSEWDYARRAASYYGTTHHEVVIEPITPELIRWAVWHLDEPMTDLSSIPLSILCRRARQDAVVCLSGEGGDEVFVGYDRFIASKIDARWYGRMPGVVRRGLVEPLVRRLPDRPQKKGAVNLLKRFVEGAALPVEGGHLRWQYFSSAEQDRALFSPGLLARVSADPFAPVRLARARAGSVDRLGKECYIDLRMTMPESVLMKVDKMSMAHSLEVRVPFLDHEVVEFAAGIPSETKFPGLRTKAIYRKAMEGILPPFILERGKQGYSLPIKNWLREDLRDFMSEVLNTSELVREHFQIDFVNTLIAEHVGRTHNHNHVLWALINLALWHERFIEQRSSRAA